MPSSIAAPLASTKDAFGTPGATSGNFPSSRSAKDCRSGPDTRTTPMPPRPGAVAIAAMTSGAHRHRVPPASRLAAAALPLDHAWICHC